MHLAIKTSHIPLSLFDKFCSFRLLEIGVPRCFNDCSFGTFKCKTRELTESCMGITWDLPWVQLAILMQHGQDKGTGIPENRTLFEDPRNHSSSVAPTGLQNLCTKL